MNVGFCIGWLHIFLNSFLLILLLCHANRKENGSKRENIGMFNAVSYLFALSSLLILLKYGCDFYLILNGENKFHSDQLRYRLDEGGFVGLSMKMLCVACAPMLLFFEQVRGKGSITLLISLVSAAYWFYEYIIDSVL